MKLLSSIKSKLILGFSAAAVLLMSSSVVGLIKLEQLRGEYENLVEVKIQALDKSRHWAGLSESNIQKRLVSMMSSDKDFVKAFTANQSEVTLKINALQKDLTELSQSPKAHELSTATNEARARYAKIRDDLVKRQAAGEDVRLEVLNALMPAMNDYQANIKKYPELMNEELHEASDRASQTIRAIEVLSTALLLIGFASGLVVVLLMANHITKSVREAQALATRIASGDLTQALQVDRADELGDLLRNLDEMQLSLAEVVGNVRGGAERVASASAEIAGGNQDLADRTAKQAMALEASAASMEDLATTVRQNADNVNQANALAKSASDVAVAGGQVVAQVVQTMRGISDSSRKIADITNVIDSIAFQTNILALNAAVEAARAGEQGRGFAIVAGEVRNLAGRSADAAKAIKDLTADSVERIEQGSALADQAGATMEDVVGSIQRATAIMGEISAASSAQKAGVTQVGSAVAQMDQATQQNAALVEEMSAAAASLRSQADDLVESVSVFKIA